MKLWLILGPVFAIASHVHATPATAPTPAATGPAADSKSVSSRALPQPRQAQTPPPARHLSEQQLAELRRQLQQFNQQFDRQFVRHP